MPSRTTLGGLILALAVGGGLLLVSSATAEVGAAPSEAFPRGTPAGTPRSVVHEVWVDLGRFGDRVPWHYQVRDGDSLGRIAERELGAVRRQGEIESLNPGVKPRSLRPGQRLFMPPRQCLGSAGASWCAFFAYAPDPGGWSAPRRLDGGDIHRIGDGARVFAVPCAKLSTLLAATREGLVDGKALLADRRIPRSDPVIVMGAVSSDDPTRRIVTRYTVTAIDDGRVELARAGEARFDAAGRTLVEVHKKRKGASIPLQSLALFAMLGLLGWVVNRSRPPSTVTRVEAPPFAEDEAGEYEEGEYEEDESEEDGVYEEGESEPADDEDEEEPAEA